MNDAKDDALFWFAKLRRFDDVRLGFHLHELPSVEALSCPFLMSMYRSGRSSLLPVKDIENDLKELLTSPTDDRRVSVEDRLRLLFDVMLNVLCEVSIEIVREIDIDCQESLIMGHLVNESSKLRIRSEAE